MTTSPARACVYTALLGGYERLNEQPVAASSAIPFICFTDDPELQSETWQIRLVSPLFKLDPARSQRDLKLRPHLHLADFDRTLYIDNAVVLSQPPEQVFERYAPSSGFALSRHSSRESVLEEFLEVIRQGLADPNRVFEQLNHYTLECPEILDERPYWGGVLLRDHREPRVLSVLDIWYAHVMRYSRRDQLSVNMAFRQAGFTPDVMDIDNYSSWFHSWPHTPGRNRKRGALDPAVSLSPPVARVRQLQAQLAEAEKRHERMLSDESWLIGKWLTESAGRHPIVMGSLLRVLTSFSRTKKPH